MGLPLNDPTVNFVGVYTIKKFLIAYKKIEVDMQTLNPESLKSSQALVNEYKGNLFEFGIAMLFHEY